MFEPVHEVERATIAAQPSLGQDDVSKCLPGWIVTLGNSHLLGNGIELSKQAVSNLLHTLIAAHVRQHRLIDEREAARDQAGLLSDDIIETGER